LLGRPLARSGDLQHGFPQFAFLRPGRLPRAGAVHPAALLQLARAAEAEEIRRADGAVSAGNLLRLVDQIGKREIMLRREELHVLK